MFCQSSGWNDAVPPAGCGVFWDDVLFGAFGVSGAGCFPDFLVPELPGSLVCLTDFASLGPGSKLLKLSKILIHKSLIRMTSFLSKVAVCSEKFVNFLLNRLYKGFPDFLLMTIR